MPVHLRNVWTENESIRIMGLGRMILIAEILLDQIYEMGIALSFREYPIGLTISLFVQDNPQPGFFIVVFLNLILILLLISSTDMKYFLSRKPNK